MWGGRVVTLDRQCTDSAEVVPIWTARSVQSVNNTSFFFLGWWRYSILAASHQTFLQEPRDRGAR